MAYMHRLLLAVLLILIPFAASAKEYGHYNPVDILVVSGERTAKKHSIDLVCLGKIIDDLALHASGYPPQFDSLADRQRARPKPSHNFFSAPDS